MTIKLQPGAPIQDGGIWMMKPSAHGDIPPGLEYLAMVDNIHIKQKRELLEIATGWEANNKYIIMNGVGQQIYYAYEESSCCSRQCCRADRGFVLHIVDNSGKEVMRISREFRFCSGCEWCAVPGSHCAYSVAVEAPPGNVIGTVDQKVSCCRGAYQVCDQDGQVLLDCEGPGPFIMCGCGDKVFDIRTTSGAEIGAIRKKWAGFLQEAFTEADNFGVSFPLDLSVRTKATLIGATFLIDFVHFERRD